MEPARGMDGDEGLCWPVSSRLRQRYDRWLLGIGLSIDGPRPMHDAYQLDKGGRGTFDRDVRGWELLNKHRVDTNILWTVQAANARHPAEVHRFFRQDAGARGTAGRGQGQRGAEKKQGNRR